jgi:hypothetical protein
MDQKIQTELEILVGIAIAGVNHGCQGRSFDDKVQRYICTSSCPNHNAAFPP